MARGKKKKEGEDKTMQINCRLPMATVERVDYRWHRKGWDRRLQIIAGLIAFDMMSDADRERLISLATWAVDREKFWDDLGGGAVGGLSNMVDHEAVERLFVYLLQLSREAPTGDRLASSG